MPRRHQALPAAIEELSGLKAWGPKTRRKHTQDFRRFLGWLEAEGRPLTTESLDWRVLLAYVRHLELVPQVRGVWRGDKAAMERARAASTDFGPSKNTIRAYMSPLRTLCTYLLAEGVLKRDPFVEAKRRSADRRNPLLPSEERPYKSATAGDVAILLRATKGRTALDLRDRAMDDGLADRRDLLAPPRRRGLGAGRDHRRPGQVPQDPSSADRAPDEGGAPALSAPGPAPAAEQCRGGRRGRLSALVLHLPRGRTPRGVGARQADPQWVLAHVLAALSPGRRQSDQLRRASAPSRYRDTSSRRV